MTDICSESMGGGRGWIGWAERIGKKYQWVAMFQLASRLHDHVEPKHDSWQPKPQRTPLILLEERKLDPTLPPTILAKERQRNVWWIRPKVDIKQDRRTSDAEWVSVKEDLPVLDELLAPIDRNGYRWRLLMSRPSWGTRNEDADSTDSYRHVWIHLESYLVPKREFATAYRCLQRRNFFGRWMPEGATWLYRFTGEYPWATAFNTETEEWHGKGRSDDLPAHYTPCWSEVAVEWKYDASLPGNFYMIVPAREFFGLKDLWWDGRDGYRLVDGNTIFRDPSITEGGPAALVADTNELLKRLDRLGLRLLWTLLGEKILLGGVKPGSTPRRTFSQIARIEDDGSVTIGERVFFDDYYRDKGPAVAKDRGSRRTNEEGRTSKSK